MMSSSFPWLQKVQYNLKEVSKMRILTRIKKQVLRKDETQLNISSASLSNLHQWHSINMHDSPLSWGGLKFVLKVGELVRDSKFSKPTVSSTRNVTEMRISNSALTRFDKTSHFLSSTQLMSFSSYNFGDFREVQMYAKFICVGSPEFLTESTRDIWVIQLNSNILLFTSSFSRSFGLNALWIINCVPFIKNDVNTDISRNHFTGIICFELELLRLHSIVCA